jgi:hypothetical protein
MPLYLLLLASLLMLLFAALAASFGERLLLLNAPALCHRRRIHSSARAR